MHVGEDQCLNRVIKQYQGYKGYQGHRGYQGDYRGSAGKQFKPTLRISDPSDTQNEDNHVKRVPNIPQDIPQKVITCYEKGEKTESKQRAARVAIMVCSGYRCRHERWGGERGNVVRLVYGHEDVAQERSFHDGIGGGEMVSGTYSYVDQKG